MLFENRSVGRSNGREKERERKSLSENCLLHLYVSFDRIHLMLVDYEIYLGLTHMTTYRVELRVEFPFCHFAISSILRDDILPVQRVIGYSAYACLCHKYAMKKE